MPEYQQYKGELWNDRAIRLLELFSWETIGARGIDIGGSDDKKYGIDSFFSFDDPSKDLSESVILEAKSYKTTSMSKTVLEDWIKVLNKKILNLRNSEDLFNMFPIFKSMATLKTGIIIAWFDDTQNYLTFRGKFQEMLTNINLSSKPLKDTIFNRIFVIDNDIILKLCSLYTSIKDIRNSGSSFNFYYPSPLIGERAIVKTDILSIEYIFSKFILAQAKDNGGKLSNIVFYWGDLNVQSFQLLKSALKLYSFIDRELELIIYKYQRDEVDFYKIEPVIKNSFENEGIKFEIREMESYERLPTFIIN